MKMQVWVVALVVALGLTACGGAAQDTTEEPSQAAQATSAPTAAAGVSLDDWVDTALAGCAQVNEATADAEPEGDPFSPQATDADREQGITFLHTFGEALGTYAEQLRAAGTPDEKAAEAEAFIGAVEETGAAFDEAAATAEEDFAKAQPAVGKAFGAFPKLEGAAAEVGIGDLESCEREGKAAEAPAAGANEVPVVATEAGGTYHFEFAAEVPAGKTAFVMSNEDDEAHFMALVEVSGKGALAKAIKAEAAGNSDAADKFLVDEEVGGSEEAAPGEQAVANVTLKPGTYGMLCFIPGPDGKPHAFNGMAQEFTVTP